MDICWDCSWLRIDDGVRRCWLTAEVLDGKKWQCIHWAGRIGKTRRGGK